MIDPSQETILPPAFFSLAGVNKAALVRNLQRAFWYADKPWDKLIQGFFK
jgi:hypothetical protein